MKQDVNPMMIAAAVVVLLLLVVFVARRSLSGGGSGPNPYQSANAPKGVTPGLPPGGLPNCSGTNGGRR